MTEQAGGAIVNTNKGKCVTVAALHSNKKRILVADDELHSVTILRDFLDARGYEVVTAMDGQEAVDRFRNEGPFDLVLLDVMMPGMNGWQVCARLKEMNEGADTPVLMVSALGQPEHIERSRKEGADDYVVKPVRFLDLDARVRSMLSKQDTGPQNFNERALPSLTSEIMSPIDSLTGLFNSQYFSERLHREFHRAGSHRGQIAVLLCEPQDAQSEGQQDELLLCRIARAVGDAILPRDVACRLDGARFAVIACGAKPREAHRLAEMIRWGVDRATGGSERQAVTLCVGMAHRADLEEQAGPDHLFELAKRALEQARTSPNHLVDAAEL